jgi:hypothetical protein
MIDIYIFNFFDIVLKNNNNKMNSKNNSLFSIFQSKVKQKLLKFNSYKNYLAKTWFGITFFPLAFFYGHLFFPIKEQHPFFHYLPYIVFLFTISYSVLSIQFLNKKRAEIKNLYQECFNISNSFEQEYKIFLISSIYHLNYQSESEIFRQAYTQNDFINYQLIFDKIKKERKNITSDDFFDLCQTMLKIETIIPQYEHLHIEQLEHIILSILDNALKVNDDYFLSLQENQNKEKSLEKKLNQSL